MRRIGLLIPKTNLTVEYELQYLLNKQIIKHEQYSFYIAKLDYKTSYKENKLQYLKELAEDSYQKIIDLQYLNVNYIAFFCTSSAIISDKITTANNPATSLIEEAKERKISKCLLITPYNEELGKKVKSELEKNGISVLKNINLNLLNTEDYFDFGINKLKKFIIENYRNSYENIIISCTNIPTIHFINELEKLLNTQIISSNSSLFNKILRENQAKGI